MPRTICEHASVDESTCAHGSDGAKPNQEWTACDVCDKWYHTGCSGLTTDQQSPRHNTQAVIPGLSKEL